MRHVPRNAIGRRGAGVPGLHVARAELYKRPTASAVGGAQCTLMYPAATQPLAPAAQHVLLVVFICTGMRTLLARF